MADVIDGPTPADEGRAMFYGWRIVSVVFLTHFISVGLVFYSYGVFFKTLAAEFGGSRLGVATGLVIMNVVVAAVSPYLGRMVDHRSIRKIMCGGACLMAAGFLAAAGIGALWQFYLLMGTLLAVGAAMLGALAGSALITNWFSERRGIALGISGMGISLSGLAMAPVATLLIAAIGWRGTFLVYGVVTLATVVPAVWFTVVNRPEDMGLLPDGAPPSAKPSAAGELSPVSATAPLDWSVRGTLRELNFWVIALVIGLNFCANGAVLTHIIPYATDIGFEPMKAAWVLSTMAGFGVLGKVVFGWIADRVPKRVAIWIATGLQGLGLLLISNAQEYSSLLLAGTIFGLGMGGVIPLWGALIGAGFGRQAFGRVMGLMGPAMLPIHVLGIPYAGWIYDRTGNYEIAFFTFVGIYVLATAVLLLLRLPGLEPGSATTASRLEEPDAGVVVPDG
jgi:MFS family permease